MQLSAITVDWDRLQNLRSKGSIDEAVWNAGKELRVGEPPWPSDSTMQLLELSQCYEAIKGTLTGASRANADKIMEMLIDKSFAFPWELKTYERGDHLIGAISPSTVREYLKIFSRISYSELDEAFDSRMPTAARKSCEIASTRVRRFSPATCVNGKICSNMPPSMRPVYCYTAAEEM